MRVIAAVVLLTGLPCLAADVPAERNGWTLLVEACGLVKSSDYHDLVQPGGYPDPWHPTRPGVLSHLAANAPALAKLDEALARPELVRPATALTDDFETSSGQFGKWRELSRLKCQRAHLRRAQGDLAGALRDVEDVLTLAERLDQSGGMAIDYMVTRAMEAIALANAGLLLGPPPVGLDPARLSPLGVWPVPPYSPAERAAWQPLARHMADENGCLPALRSALAGEQVYFAHETRRRNPELPAPLSEADMAQLVDWRRRVGTVYAEMAARPAWQRDPLADATLTPPAVISRLGEAADSVADTSWLRHLAQRLDVDRAWRRMGVVAIALRLYAGDHYRLPSTLADLVQEGYLVTVPLDPLTNGAIGYEPVQGILYCGGLADGRPQPSLRTRLDFVVTVGLTPYAPTPEDAEDWAFETWLKNLSTGGPWPRRALSTLR